MGLFTEELRASVGGDSRERNEADIEINGKTFSLFAYPLTGADMDAIARKNKGFMESPTMGAMADLLIRKVRDQESGEKAFDMKDKQLILRMPLSWFQETMSQLLPDAEADFSEDAIEGEVKN